MKEETKYKLRDFKNKLSLLKAKIKDFNFTKYLLNRKERNFQTQIKTKEELVEFHIEQIVIDKAHIIATESEIAILKKGITQLEKDVKKIIKVINLYID